MAGGPVNVCLAPGDLLHLLQFNRDRGRDYLGSVSGFVSKHKGKSLVLESPAGATLTIGDLSDTIYRDKRNEVNGWGKFYLPKEVSMQVVGVVEETSCPCDQLVLMTCEDRKLYAYDGEELHEVASSLKQLGEKRIEYPASTSYYNGEAFKDMTEKDWVKVREGAVGKSLDQAHHKLVTAQKSRFLQNLKIK
ncbi:uncharacterized protein LOC119906763 isoform X2 [Micropterus salmoides]|uniref:uncharacterized protein LOC119906759 isoform X2 n=1 Tax=Micropterus salmoides TaxID=27706 RepID=UPI0018EA741D|nr:uncharacterized protein LOC119906759 isoform X2 [Micropterus salmoides]XP_038580027.1 uncharacterized protein LOC119906759 isoform X2 [Micropterus salmoides]XP_038580035.1 uncharacterized protein LOC119906763 isoform X2 [Micropterus salmoides]